MPCTVEFLEPDSFWYCCNCGDGPMVAAVSSACTSCNDHQRCSSNACIPTPPDSPTWPSGTRRKLREYASDLRVSKSGPIVTTSQASPRRNGNLDLDRDVVIASNIEAYKEASITPFDEGQISLQAAIEQHTNAIVDFQHSLLPHVDTTSTPEVTSCPTGRQAPPRAPNNSLQRITQQQPGKRSRRRNAKASGGQKDDQESDDDVSSEPPRGRLALNQNGQPDVELACPFCKFNPHRYRHEKSCGQGKPTASKLRGHLTRDDNNPHKLSDCITCLQVFPNDQERDEHEKLRCCDWKSLSYPAEGVSSRLLRSEDKTQNIPMLPSGHTATPQEVYKWWEKVYRMIHGQDAEFPDNIYHNANENIRRSNDPALQDDFRDHLRRTLRCRLPESILRKAVRYHLLSTLDSEKHRLLGFSGSEEYSASALEVLSRSWDVQRGKASTGDPERLVNPQQCRPRTNLSDKAREQPGSSISEVISSRSRDFRDLISPPTQRQQHNSSPTQMIDGMHTNTMLAPRMTKEYTATTNAHHEQRENEIMMSFDLNASTATSPQALAISTIDYKASTPALEPNVAAYLSSPSTMLVSGQALQEAEPLLSFPPPKRQRLSEEEEQRVQAAVLHRAALYQPENRDGQLEHDTTYTQEDHHFPGWDSNQTSPGVSDESQLPGYLQSNDLFSGSVPWPQNPEAEDWTVEELGEIFSGETYNMEE